MARSVREYTFDNMHMTLTLEGLGEVTIDLCGLTETGRMVDGTVKWKEEMTSEDLDLVSGAIRGDEAKAEELCRQLMKAVESLA